MIVVFLDCILCCVSVCLGVVGIVCVYEEFYDFEFEFVELFFELVVDVVL